MIDLIKKIFWKKGKIVEYIPTGEACELKFKVRYNKKCKQWYCIFNKSKEYFVNEKNLK